jgi:hypothetical protein
MFENRCSNVTKIWQKTKKGKRVFPDFFLQGESEALSGEKGVDARHLHVRVNVFLKIMN